MDAKRSFFLVLILGIILMINSCSSLERENTSGSVDADRNVSDDKSTIDGAGGLHDTEEETSGEFQSTPDRTDLSLNKKREDGRSGTKGESSSTRPSAQGVSGLKAGFADDNKQFNYYINFQKKFKSKARHIPINVSERVSFHIKDRNKKTIPNALVKIYSRNNLLFSAKTYSDGSCIFFPSQYRNNTSKYKAVVSSGQMKKTFIINRFGKRNLDLILNTVRPSYNRVPLDIVFIFDTTGSMGEEIARLKRTIELIYLNLTSLPSRPRVRFGMVLYKDRLDQYVTQTIPLTGNLEHFQGELDKVSASGGGDLPEDLQSALADTMQKMRWNRQGIRLSFIITDAPPHLDYGQRYTYKHAVVDARKKGIKMFSVGTGGLDINGEYVLRQIAQYTSGKYIFLTYGEKGESKGGVAGSVSHHSGANFQTGKLETIIMKFARNEIYNLSKDKQQEDEEYFTAVKVGTENKEETLQKLFTRAVGQLSDYSSIKIPSGVATSVLPINSGNKRDRLNSEYFTEQLIFSMTKSKRFKLVARKNLQNILAELSLSQTGLIDEKNAAKVGKILGAKMLVTGRLFRRKGKYEVYLKLLRVETAEVLSVTKTKIDEDLCLKE